MHPFEQIWEKSFHWIESIIKVGLCCEMAGAKAYCEEYRIALAT